MSAATPETTQLLGWLDRMRTGDVAAREDVFRHCRGRLERLTRKMLNDYPRVRRWERTDDVLQNALIRLLRALNEVHLKSTREFFGLATLQIRRELLDLAKHYYGPQGEGANHASVGGGPHAPEVPDKADLSADPSRLAMWCEAHEQVERLPEEQREVFSLLYYQGLTKLEAAAILNIDRNTVRLRWQQALLKLDKLLENGA